MKRFLAFLLLLSLPCVLCRCTEGEKSEPEKEKPDTRIGERTDEMPEYCSILDGKLRVMLAANATTGYSWTNFVDHEEVLACDAENYVPDGVEEGLCGAGGTYIADFSPKEDGTATLKFTYARPWENGFAKRMFVDVTVKDGVIVSVLENKGYQ